MLAVSRSLDTLFQAPVTSRNSINYMFSTFWFFSPETNESLEVNGVQCFAVFLGGVELLPQVNQIAKFLVICTLIATTGI